MERINLGDLVKDSITSFTGIVVADTQWLHGCRRLNVQPRELDKDNKIQDLQSFDELQLVLIEQAKVKTTSASNVETGGPMPTIQRM